MSRLIQVGLAALLASLLSSAPVGSVEKATTVKPTLKSAQIKRQTVGGGTVVGPVGGGPTAAELSAYECRQVGGTVVTVGDDRCGASRKYCRMPDTNAVCIDELSAD
jgi:hypothetical protein